MGIFNIEFSYYVDLIISLPYWINHLPNDYYIEGTKNKLWKSGIVQQTILNLTKVLFKDFTNNNFFFKFTLNTRACVR